MKVLKTLEFNVSQKSYDEQLLNLMIIAGLSNPQARVYLELVKMKKGTASDLCTSTGIKNSRIYNILSELEHIGLIAVQTSAPKVYVIRPLIEGIHNLEEQLNKNFRKRKKAIKDLTVNLTPLFDSVVSIPTTTALIIKGRKNINNKIHHELSKVNKEVIIRLPSFDLYQEFEARLIQLQEEGVKINAGFTQREIDCKKSGESQLSVCTSDCECFYLMIDRDYLLSVSNWDSDKIFAIWTTDISLINITSAYFSHSCNR